ncbi:phosphoglycerate dehydrogenase, partial [Elusimicrobiota bacterium]
MHSNEKTKILITDSLSQDGIDILEKEGFSVKMDPSLDGEALGEEIKGYDGLIIRSATNVTIDIIEKADKLKIIGRAGVGVDNVDVTAATRKGILVMNTPGGNTISACEHTWALILSVLRNVPPAHQALREGRWDKKKYKGTELFGKTLGVIGLGKIGAEVAKRAIGFGMEVIVYDPFTSEEKAREVKAEIVSFDDLLKTADIITIHVPKNDKTKNMINAETLAKMKKSAFLINCARGGIVDEEALAEAINNGTIKGAGVDVYETEPTTESPIFKANGIIHTPHLGAATVEAQERVAIEICKQVIGYLKDEKIINAVNIVSMDIDPAIEELAQKLGIFCGKLSENLTEKVIISYKDTIENEEALTRTVLKGYLSQFNEGVNFVNVFVLAAEKGIELIRQRRAGKDLIGEIEMTLGKDLVVSGSIIGGSARLTGINGYILDIPLSGNMLIIKNHDRPGVIGHIGTILGENEVNIGYMEVGRKSAGGPAFTVIGVDGEVTSQVIDSLKSREDIEYVN